MIKLELLYLIQVKTLKRKIYLVFGTDSLKWMNQEIEKMVEAVEFYFDIDLERKDKN